MIAIDTSSFISFFSGNHGTDVDAVQLALNQKQAVLPPLVLSELLSDPQLSPAVARLLLEMPLLSLHEGYWERAGQTRAKIIAKGFRARLADALISQICIDHHIPLIARDNDFRHFSKFCGLKLLL